MRKKPWSGMRKPKKQNKEYLLYCKMYINVAKILGMLMPHCLLQP